MNEKEKLAVLAAIEAGEIEKVNHHEWYIKELRKNIMSYFSRKWNKDNIETMKDYGKKGGRPPVDK